MTLSLYFCLFFMLIFILEQRWLWYTGESDSSLIRGFEFESWIWKKISWESHPWTCLAECDPHLVGSLMWTSNIRWKKKNLELDLFRFLLKNHIFEDKTIPFQELPKVIALFYFKIVSHFIYSRINLSNFQS